MENLQISVESCNKFNEPNI
uniref:Uncharacterized protein n=1 Tax=Arundo donax TaxID=35708 RepID=A0A0A9CLR6_ARUDO